MTDRQWQFCLVNYILRRYSAGPENRCFSLSYCDKITIIRLLDSGNTDLSGIADMHGRSVNIGISSCYCYSIVDSVIGDRTHGNHHGAMEITHWGQRKRGAIHGHIFLFIEVAQRNACVNKGFFKRKAAAEQEKNKI